MRMPSLSSSPRMRSAPQRTLALAMAWISSMTSGAQPPAPAFPPGPAPPEEREQVAVPAQQRVGRDHMEGIAPGAIEAGQQHEEEPVLTVEARPPGRRPSEHKDLLAEQRVLGHQLQAGPEDIEAGGARERCRGADGPQQTLHGPAKCRLAQTTTAMLTAWTRRLSMADLLSRRRLGHRSPRPLRLKMRSADAGRPPLATLLWRVDDASSQDGVGTSAVRPQSGNRRG